MNIAVKVILTIILLAVNCAAIVLVINNIKKIMNSKLNESEGKVTLYESILDSMPISVNVVDSDLKWVYLNKANESAMVRSGVIKNRDSAYGLKSNKSKTSINTENTSVLKDHYGKDFGFVEIVMNNSSNKKSRNVLIINILIKK